jgi:hypothetical protein
MHGVIMKITAYKYMMHYVKSGEKRRRGHVERVAQENAATKYKQYCVCV